LRPFDDPLQQQQRFLVPGDAIGEALVIADEVAARDIFVGSVQHGPDLF
jgi:hypothetical protein